MSVNMIAASLRFVADNSRPDFLPVTDDKSLMGLSRKFYLSFAKNSDVFGLQLFGVKVLSSLVIMKISVISLRPHPTTAKKLARRELGIVYPIEKAQARSEIESPDADDLAIASETGLI